MCINPSCEGEFPPTLRYCTASFPSSRTNSTIRGFLVVWFTRTSYCCPSRIAISEKISSTLPQYLLSFDSTSYLYFHSRWGELRYSAVMIRMTSRCASISTDPISVFLSVVFRRTDTVDNGLLNGFFADRFAAYPRLCYTDCPCVPSANGSLRASAPAEHGVVAVASASTGKHEESACR